MYDPNNPQQPGGFSITSHMGAGPKPANAYAIQQGGGAQAAMAALQGRRDMRQPQMQQADGWQDAFRAARPDQDTFGIDRAGWRNALMGWRDSREDYRFPQQAAPVVPPVAPAPVVPPMSAPMVVPPNYQLPTYQYGG